VKVVRRMKIETNSKEKFSMLLGFACLVLARGLVT